MIFTDLIFLAGFVAGTVFWTVVAFALAVYYDPRVTIKDD